MSPVTLKIPCSRIVPHYVIPKKFENHRIVKRLNYNTDSIKNIVYLPNLCAQHDMCIFPDKIYSHQINHNKYDMYVEKQLDYVEDIYEFDSLVDYLKRSLKCTDKNN